MINFSNTYSQLPSQFYEISHPTRFPNPELIRFNKKLATEIGIDFDGVEDHELAQVFSGQKILPGSEPLAMAYAGHQFGHQVPQLGDGRAHLLGEVSGFDVQLKGSGQTRFSRRGDGRSALGPVLREYIVSEAMHALSIPTTRALCAVATGEKVLRQYGAEPGGVFTRVADSHIRVGTFQYFAFQKDTDSLKILLDYTIQRHYPKISNVDNYREKSLALLNELVEKQSTLIAQWSSVGFIHGVMNTDNFSLAGITIDYGPCAFMDEFSFNKTFSSIDQQGRYSYFNQAPIAKWNIFRLAECLLPLIDENFEKAANIVEEQIVQLMEKFEFKRTQLLARKLGIEVFENNKEDEQLVMDFLHYLEEESLDFTISFRELPNLFEGKTCLFPKSEAFNSFFDRWKSRVSNIEKLNSINPCYIPRNHQIQKAIDDAYNGDYALFHKLNEVYQNPFEERQEYDEFSRAPKSEERVTKTYCGT